MAAVLARYDGCGTVKVKVAEPGQSLADDVDRVAATRDVAGPDVKIRVDANAAWDVDEAVRRITALAVYDLEYAEQPCPSVDDLKELRVRLARNGIDVPIAADESIRKAEDPIRVAREGAADIVIVKVPPLGGVRRALEISAECGLPPWSARPSTPRSGWPPASRSRPRCPGSRMRAASAPSSCSPPMWPTTGSCRSAARCRSARRGPTTTSSTRRPPPSDRVALVARSGWRSCHAYLLDRSVPRS